jgi:hypothetical protein
MKEDAL